MAQPETFEEYMARVRQAGEGRDLYESEMLAPTPLPRPTAVNVLRPEQKAQHGAALDMARQITSEGIQSAAPEGYHYAPDNTLRPEEERQGIRFADMRYRLAPGPAPDRGPPMMTLEDQITPEEAQAIMRGDHGTATANMQDHYEPAQSDPLASLARPQDPATVMAPVQAKAAEVRGSLQSLARPPAPVQGSTYNPVEESLGGVDPTNFGNTAADRQWFERQHGAIDSSTPEGYARSRELQAMEPDFSQRMSEPELSKMDAGFQAIARDVRPSGVAPAAGSPRPQPTQADLDRDFGNRFREEKLRQLSRGPQEDPVKAAQAAKFNAQAAKAQAEADRLKRRGQGGGPAMAAGADPTVALARQQVESYVGKNDPNIAEQFDIIAKIRNPKARKEALRGIVAWAKNKAAAEATQSNRENQDEARKAHQKRQEDDQFTRNARQYGADVGGWAEIDGLINEYEAANPGALGANPGDIEGVGPADGWVPDMAHGLTGNRQALINRRLLSDLNEIYARERSGAAISLTEDQRFKLQTGTSETATAQETAVALQVLRKWARDNMRAASVGREDAARESIRMRGLDPDTVLGSEPEANGGRVRVRLKSGKIGNVPANQTNHPDVAEVLGG